MSLILECLHKGEKPAPDQEEGNGQTISDARKGKMLVRTSVLPLYRATWSSWTSMSISLGDYYH